MENVSHERCCAPLKSGGLNIVNFETKCSSLRLSNFLSLGDSFGLCKWHYFVRYFLGNRLAAVDGRYCFLSNLVLSASRPSHYYIKCLDSLRVLHTKIKTGSLPDDLSCKNLNNLLLVIPSAASRCAGFWGSVIGLPINRWAWVWYKCRFKLVENKKNDILWLLVHRAIRVRYALKTWGYSCDKCVVCSRPETIEHCFLDCPRVVQLWDHFTLFISDLLDLPFSVSPASAYVVFSFDQSSAGASLCDYLLARILYWIWFA